MFDRRDIKEEPKWGNLIFGDGYEAQVIGMVPGKEKGEEYWEFVLRPYDSLAKRYRITLEMVDRDLALIRRYPQEYIISLNLDPIKTTYFCLLDFNGKATPATEMLLGKSQADTINFKNKQLFILNARIAYLTEKLKIAETNIHKYVKDNMEVFGDATGSLFKQMLQQKGSEELPTTQ